MLVTSTLRGRSRAATLAAEDGFALPIAISILVLAGMLVLTAVTLATHNTDRANRDRAAVRAAQAADAGADAALYRLNKALTASQAEGVLGQPVAAVAETVCIEVNLGQIATLSADGGWCQVPGGSEQLDGPIEGETGDPAAYAYWVSSGVNVGTDPGDASASLIERRIVSIGTVGDVTKRVLATARMRIGSGGNLLSPFEQIGYRVCPPEPSDASDPASGC